LGWGVGLQHQRVDTRFAGSQIEVQSPTINKLLLSLDGSWQLGAQQIKTNLVWHKGVDVAGASSKPAGASSLYPAVRFDKLHLALQTERNWFAGGYRFGLQNSLSGQISQQNLFAIEQFNLGDRSSVRGGRRWVNSSNRGAALQNNLYVDVKASSVTELRPFIGFDLGRTWSSSPAEESVHLASVVAGLRVRHKTIAVSMDIAKGIQPSRTRDGAEVNLAINWFI
jgi:hemolysin activation/secretion protein